MKYLLSLFCGCLFIIGCRGQQNINVTVQPANPQVFPSTQDPSTVIQKNLDDLDRSTQQQQQQNQQYMQLINQHDRDVQQQQAAEKKARQDEMIQREANVYRAYTQISQYRSIENGDQPVYIISQNGCTYGTAKVQDNKIIGLYGNGKLFPANLLIQNQKAKTCTNGICLEFIFL